MADLSAYEQRCHAVVGSCSHQLQPITVELASEMIDHNEGAIALDMLSEMLVEAGATVTAEFLAEFDALAKLLGCEAETAARLQPLVEQNR